MGEVESAAGRSDVETAAGLARLLADPLRLTMLQFLSWGPASVAELVTVTGASQPNVSNHLKLLREQDVVLAERRGRQTMYSLASVAIAELVWALGHAAGMDRAPAGFRLEGPLCEARTCYDHLAGRLGVRILRRLRALGAVEAADGAWAEVGPGPEAGAVFARLGIDLDAVARERGRRRFAFSCPDWTEPGAVHLGGALGAAVCDHCRAAGWLEKDDRSRAVLLTDEGRAALGWLLGTSDEPAADAGHTHGAGSEHAS